MVMTAKTNEQLNSTSRSKLNNRGSYLLKEFNLLLSKNLYNSRSVKYYANLLAVSTKKINFLTKKHYGITAKEYIEDKVIIESKKLLLETPETVKHISYSLGFTEPTNFNKFFKKLTAITPHQFREQFNKGTF